MLSSTIKNMIANEMLCGEVGFLMKGSSEPAYVISDMSKCSCVELREDEGILFICLPLSRETSYYFIEVEAIAAINTKS